MTGHADESLTGRAENYVVEITERARERLEAWRQDPGVQAEEWEIYREDGTIHLKGWTRIGEVVTQWSFASPETGVEANRVLDRTVDYVIARWARESVPHPSVDPDEGESPWLTANELVSVQPMSGPVGHIFFFGDDDSDSDWREESEQSVPEHPETGEEAEFEYETYRKNVLEMQLWDDGGGEDGGPEPAEGLPMAGFSYANLRAEDLVEVEPVDDEGGDPE